jgi:hypothetical protein
LILFSPNSDLEDFGSKLAQSIYKLRNTVKWTDEELASIIGKTNDTVLFGVLYDRYEHLVYNKCYGFASIY